MSWKSNWKLTLITVLAVAVLGFAAQALPTGEETPDTLRAAQTGEENVEPAPAPSPGEDLPPLDLDLPAPSAQCLTGWCSSDLQCAKWYGPGSTCYKQPGASCGQCLVE